LPSEAETDWTAVIALANRSWLSPALYCSLADARRLDELPEEARDYLDFLHQRTCQRNHRLRAQLLEASSALNRAGIEPTVLKGAIGLIAGPSTRIGSRLMSDIDLSVPARDVASATRALARIGYSAVEGDRSLSRPDDASVIEVRPQPPPAPVESGATSLAPKLLECEGVRAWIPSATSQVLHLVRHDMLKEGDYWRARIDLRHLYDIARLAADGEIDWVSLRAQMPSNPGRNALATQLLTLGSVFDVEFPWRSRSSTMARLQSWRCLTAAKHPVLGAPFRMLGDAAWGLKRALACERLHTIGAAELARRAGGILAGSNTGPKL
jgi:hypothetical protein